jgi:hypothetical protein
MTLLRRPLYQRTEGGDEDRWRLAFDTDSNHLFVEHEQMRGDVSGPGHAIHTDEIDLAAFLNERGHGQYELVQLLRDLFEDRKNPPGALRADAPAA